MKISIISVHTDRTSLEGAFLEEAFPKPKPDHSCRASRISARILSACTESNKVC